MSFTADALKNLSTKLGILMFIHKEKKKQDRNYYSQKNKILILILKLPLQKFLLI